MKCTILSESPADEAAIRVIVDALLGTTTTPIPGPPLRSRGWPSVHTILPSVIRHLQYQTASDGLVVVVDANGSPHTGPLAQMCDPGDKCRLCKVRRTVDETVTRLSPVPERARIQVAVGLAVPAMEGWYLCGIDNRVTERAWIKGLTEGKLPFDKRALKRDVYGTERPSLELETKCAVEQAQRLTTQLSLLEQAFPAGFGSLARDLRRWTQQAPNAVDGS